MSRSGKILMRGCSSGFSAGRYSDHYGSSLAMLKWMCWRGDTMWEAYRLFLEKLSLGSSSRCSNRSTRSLQTPKTRWLGLFWITGTEHNAPSWKVYKQTVSCACFHFLTVVIGIDLTRRNHLHIALCSEISEPSNRNASQKMVLQSAPSLRRNDMLPGSGSLCIQSSTPFTKFTRWACAIHFSEDVPYRSLSCRQLSSSTKDIGSTLSYHQKLAVTTPRSQLTGPLPRQQPKALSLV